MLCHLIADVNIAKNGLYAVSSCSDNVCDKTAQVSPMYKQAAAAQYHLNNDLQ